MEKNKIKVLVKEPYKAPYEKEIEATLKQFQAIVGGYIESVEMPGIKNVDLFCNEEGKMERLDGNFWLPEYDDCICGTCYMVGYNPRTGESISLTDKQISQCKKYIDNYQIPKGLDLYLDFPLLEKYMKSKYNAVCKKANAVM